MSTFIPSNFQFDGLTPYAKKYGLDRDPDSEFTEDGKSGLTPTLPPSIIPPDPKDDTWEKIQRRDVLCGFTARELEDLGCYPDPNATLRVLTNHIHNCFNVKNWESATNVLSDKIMLPIVGQGDGFNLGPNPGSWCAENPIVWEVLEPVLRLVTRFLENVHTNEFFDALLCNGLYKIPGEPDNYFEMIPQAPNDRDPNKVKQRIYDSLMKGFRLSFGDPAVQNNYTPKVQNPSSWWALTWMDATSRDDARAVNCTLNIAQWKPLLRNDLSASERMCCQWRCAMTLFHELAHVLEFCEHGGYEKYFFQDQIFSEVGFAAALSILGGRPDPFVTYRDTAGLTELNDDNEFGFPPLGMWLTSYPSCMNAGKRANTGMRDGAVLPDEDIIRPIQSQYFEYMHSDEFWDNAVSRWGLDTLKPSLNIQTEMSTPDQIAREYSDPVVISLGSRWYEDGNPATHPTQTEISLMSAIDRGAYRIAEQTRINLERATKNAKFQNGRSNFVSSMREAWEVVTWSWREDDLPQTIQKLRDLSELLLKESCIHSRDIANFVFNKDQDAAHRRYLRTLNHYMRNMAKDFDINHADQSQDQGLIRDAAEMRKILDACLVMLNDPDTGTAQDWKVYYDDAKSRATPDNTRDLVINAPQLAVAMLDPAFWVTLLDDAKIAIAAKDTARITVLANTFIDSLSSMPFFRAVGKILLSHDGSLVYRSLCDHLAPDELDALNSNDDVSDDIADGWFNIREDRIAEVEAEYAANLQTQKDIDAQLLGEKTAAEKQAEADRQAEAEKNQAEHIARIAKAQTEKDKREAEQAAGRALNDDETDVIAAAAAKRVSDKKKNSEARKAGKEEERKEAKSIAQRQVSQQPTPPSTPQQRVTAAVAIACPQEDAGDDGGYMASLQNVWFLKKYVFDPLRIPPRKRKASSISK